MIYVVYRVNCDFICLYILRDYLDNNIIVINCFVVI